jgi:hypothetical protein
MPVTECPHCGAWLKIAELTVRDPLRCPQCGEYFPLFDIDDKTRQISRAPDDPEATQKMPLR